jgi:hypothetical protein
MVERVLVQDDSRNKLLWRGTAWGACLMGTFFALAGYFTFEFLSPLRRSLEYGLLFLIEAAFVRGLIGVSGLALSSDCSQGRSCEACSQAAASGKVPNVLIRDS